MARLALSPGIINSCARPGASKTGCSATFLRIIRSLSLGKVNSADKLYLVLESVRLDTKHARCANAPAHVDGAGGSPIE